MGGPPIVQSRGKRASLHISGSEKEFTITLPSAQALWLKNLLQEGNLHKARGGVYPSWRDTRQAFPDTAAHLDEFLQQPSWIQIRAAGLLLV